MGASAPREWRLSQVFGERTPGEVIEDVDIISAIEFESRGEYLATGDHGGRIVLFERTEGFNPHSRKELEHMDYPTTIYYRYAYKTEFQSHEPEFDYLKSLEIDGKINKIKWCAAPNNSLFILSTNNRTIKLWKVLPYKVKKVKEMDLNPSVSSENMLLAENNFMAEQNESFVPNDYRLEWLTKKHKSLSPPTQGDPLTMFNIGDGTYTRCKRVYTHAHDYNINSISNNSDGESFISADDLRINLWNLEINNQCFNIIDMKPSNMDDLIEVITAAEFHPIHCNLLAFGSSRGFIRLFDMRQSALCDQNARMLKDRESHGSRSFFTEIVASISDLKFAKDGRHILSRDYMNLNYGTCTWKEHLLQLLRCTTFSALSNTFRIFSRDDGHEVGLVLDVSKNAHRPTHPTNRRSTRRLRRFAWGQRGNENSGCDIRNVIPCDFTAKVIHMGWHPTANIVACASANSLYIYCS